MAEKTCYGCGVEAGKFHEPGCLREECPFCHGQLVSCDCCYEHLKLDPEQEPTYSHGLNEEQQKEWDKILREKGLIPYGSETMY